MVSAANDDAVLSGRFAALEDVLLSHTNGRGDLAKLRQTGALLRGCEILASVCCEESVPPNIEKAKKVVILTGFPCCEDSAVKQETDGLAGAVAVARAVGRDRAVLAIESEGIALLAAALRAAEGHHHENIDHWQMLELPSAREDHENLAAFRNRILETTPYVLVAIERAAPSGLTMRGRDVSRFCTPGWALTELWEGAEATVAIGDGGNELGLGGLRDLIADHIPLGEKIACPEEFAARAVVIAGVSNWGGYALAVGMAMLTTFYTSLISCCTACGNAELVGWVVFVSRLRETRR